MTLTAMNKRNEIDVNNTPPFAMEYGHVELWNAEQVLIIY